MLEESTRAAILTPSRPAPAREREGARLMTFQRSLADRRETTLHVARFPIEAVRVRVVVLGPGQTLAAWCAATGVRHAIVGGFFVRPDGLPLGELRTDGLPRLSLPFLSPWDTVRACVWALDGRAAIARRDELPTTPHGDLLQAGPLLVRNGMSMIRAGEDPEGFSAGAVQFDSDITVGRYPRAALALTARDLLAVAADGRSQADAGLTLAELANALVDLGAHTAINLDGGGSTSLVYDGRLRNHPRADARTPIRGGRPVATALALDLDA